MQWLNTQGSWLKAEGGGGGDRELGDSLERLLAELCSFDCHYNKLFHQWNTFVSEVSLSEKSCEWWVNLSQKKQHSSLPVWWVDPVISYAQQCDWALRACADRASASWTVTLSNSELIIPDVTRVGWHILAFQFPLCDGKQYVFTCVCLCVMIFVIKRTSLNSDEHLEWS